MQRCSHMQVAGGVAVIPGLAEGTPVPLPALEWINDARDLK